MSPAEQGAADLKPDRQMIDPRSNQQLAGRMTDGTDYFSIADHSPRIAPVPVPTTPFVDNFREAQLSLCGDSNDASFISFETAQVLC
jgi:hypothetical protein